MAWLRLDTDWFGGEGWSAVIAPQFGEGTLGLALIGRN
jgi:hypothetical protein